MSTKFVCLLLVAFAVLAQTEAYYLAYPGAYAYPAVAPYVAAPYAYAAYAPAAYALWGSNKGKAMNDAEAPKAPSSSGLTNSRQ